MFKKEYIWIGLASIILGIFIAFQMKFVQGTYLDGATPAQKTTELLKEINIARNEKETLIEEIERLQEQLDAIQDSASEENVIIRNLTEELNRYKAFAGMTKVSGMGVMVTVDNPPQDVALGIDKNIAYEYRLILELINELNSAGCEAISINEQRIVNRTEIRLAGTQININTIPISPPFVIKAIGNPKTLDGALNQRFGIVQTIRESGFYIEVKQVDTLEIQPFNGSLRFRYAEALK